MSSSQFSQDSGEFDAEIVTLYDEDARSLDCYVENSLELDGSTYLLLTPTDSPVVILAWDEDEEDDLSGDTIQVEDNSEIEEIFPDARAVLAELDLNLKNTAYTLTVGGDLPPVEEDDIFTLESETEEGEDDSEELQFLASFFYKEQKYNVCARLKPLLFVAHQTADGKLQPLYSDDEELQYILEELLFEELD